MDDVSFLLSSVLSRRADNKRCYLLKCTFEKVALPSGELQGIIL
ncbi:hypothetical protein Ctu_1p00680 (plasmid) [Cronobacter turicensis z3032]|uniref:Uncharacterized protein n=1 Tax=Cronobacter turicensis (strain DSM 18703 / CCUG 55852 / LMG 23827 / z3032) TaxID=693216 RepID=C9Y5G0_CROTZ|nr:hypothetical protein Ctu_1p00680 [Cronobacter turicensis z3032]